MELEPYPAEIGPTDAEGQVNVIVDTPKESRNKYKYDEKRRLFKLSAVEPSGHVFPFDFGFIPGTLGADGDPLDVLVVLESPTFVGCWIQARLLGVIEAEQTSGGKTERNDRMIAVAVCSRLHADLRSLEQMNPKLLEEIEHFFVSYNEVKGSFFKPLGRHGPDRAWELVNKGIRAR